MDSILAILFYYVLLTQEDCPASAYAVQISVVLPHSILGTVVGSAWHPLPPATSTWVTLCSHTQGTLCSSRLGYL